MSTSQLILTLDGQVIKEYTIGERPITVGRKHSNDIQLNDLTVSGRHALFNQQNHQLIVEDLGSTNGTLVNGIHIKKAVLKHGDIIQAGHHQFTYLCEGETKYEPTMFIKAELDETQITLPEWASREEEISGQPLGGLRTLNGPLSRTTMELGKPFSTIGFQGHKLALVSRGLEGYSICAAHAPGEKGNLFTTLLNGQPLGPISQDLREGDIINIAGFEVQFFIIR